MKKVLVRGNDVPAESEVLSTSEFVQVGLEQIASTAIEIKSAQEADAVLTGMSDILDIMCSVLIAKNIDPEFLMEHASELRNLKGTFEKKVAVLKD